MNNNVALIKNEREAYKIFGHFKYKKQSHMLCFLVCDAFYRNDA